MDLTELVTWAEKEASALLSPLGDRWRHVRAVAECAREVSPILDNRDRLYLIAAAYLHDIGYAPDLQRTGLHQLDGARHVKQSTRDERLAALVAHHSEAQFEVRLRGFGDELDNYEREESLTTDALTYCDLTTGPTGLKMTMEDRIAEVEERYGEGEIVAALQQATPHLAKSVARMEQRLRHRGLLATVRR